MKRIRFNRRIVGTILGCSAILTMVVGTNVASADSTILNTIKGSGRIEYDSNNDEIADVLYDATDYTTLANGIDQLNNNVATLTTKYDELYKETAAEKKAIITSLNKAGLANINVANGTYHDIVDAIDALGIPPEGQKMAESDKLATGYAMIVPGKGWVTGSATQYAVNVFAKAGTGMLIGDAGERKLNGSNGSQVFLGIDQAAKLPVGYYNHEVIINNDVINRGAANVLLTSTSKTYHLKPGYYSGGTISTNISEQNGKITYHIGHHHYGNRKVKAWCYTKPVTVEDYPAGHRYDGQYEARRGISKSGNEADHSTFGIISVSNFHCPYCGFHTNLDESQNGVKTTWEWDSAQYHGEQGEKGYHSCPHTTHIEYEMDCGLEEGQEVRTSDKLEMKENEKLKSCSIVYE